MIKLWKVFQKGLRKDDCTIVPCDKFAMKFICVKEKEKRYWWWLISTVQGDEGLRSKTKPNITGNSIQMNPTPQKHGLTWPKEHLAPSLEISVQLELL